MSTDIPDAAPSSRGAVGIPLSRADAERRATQIRAIAEPARLRLLSLVMTHPEGQAKVGDLAAHFDLSGPTISHHLHVLYDADLLTRRRRGTSVYYAPTHHAVANFASMVTGVATDSAAVEAQLGRPNPSFESTPIGMPAVLERVTAQLAARFEGVFSPETVSRYVQESFEMLSARSRVRRFLPSLTANFATERLTALAKAEGLAVVARPDVLFVCVRNAGRSQMAAAILSQRGGGRVRVRSAGSVPISRVDTNVVSAMDEIGVYLGGTYPKPLTDEVVRASDVVVTMGCGDACPVFPGKRYLDWLIDDPAGKSIATVRLIRDDIDNHVTALAKELLAPSSGSASS